MANLISADESSRVVDYPRLGRDNVEELKALCTLYVCTPSFIHADKIGRDLKEKLDEYGFDSKPFFASLNYDRRKSLNSAMGVKCMVGYIDKLSKQFIITTDARVAESMKMSLENELVRSEIYSPETAHKVANDAYNSRMTFLESIQTYFDSKDDEERRFERRRVKNLLKQLGFSEGNRRKVMLQLTQLRQVQLEARGY